MDNTPVYIDVFLLGGGHAHVQVLKMWAMKPLPGVRLTLISPQVKTPYSGMLPGLIAGHYTVDDIHIDLARLCQFAHARFIQAPVSSIDLKSKQVHFDNRSAMAFDIVSMNTGITPDYSVPGAKEFSIPVKPISQFYPRFQAVRRALETSHRAQDIAIVGGGAAGTELAMALQYSCRNSSHQHRFHLFQKNSGLPEDYPPSVQQKVADTFRQRDIRVHEFSNITSIERSTSTPAEQDSLCIKFGAKGETFQADHLYWCTQAATPDWPKNSGLDCDEAGFIWLNNALQSLSHPFVFAAGDIARQQDYPRPRAGVYAVRQGPTLFNNLQAFCLGEKLKHFKPQKQFLSLLSCGDKSAIACKPGSGLPALSGAWVWRWKNRIDREFMKKFTVLQTTEMQAHGTQEVSQHIREQADENPNDKIVAMRCGGCGAKVGADVLSRVIKSLNPVERNDVILGLHTPDDASAITLPSDHLLIQSVDVFRALIDDPFVLGEIAANHALSDLFAMNAKAHSALAIVTLPYSAARIVERDLFQVMSGALKVLNENNCALIGGHTSEGAEMSVGFSVNGTAKATEVTRKNRPRVGDQLILTQALGTGVLFAAHGHLQSDGHWIQEATAAMLQSNRAAAELLFQNHSSACTDVTGFGLAGHLLEMLKPDDRSVSPLSAQITLENLPLLPGALACFERGFESSLHHQNSRMFESGSLSATPSPGATHSHKILYDPQTSGGLLATIAPENSKRCLERLKSAGYSQAAIIGEIIEPAPTPLILV